MTAFSNVIHAFFKRILAATYGRMKLLLSTGSNSTRGYCAQRLMGSIVRGIDVAVIYAYERRRLKDKS